MTDRYHSLTVILEKDKRDDDCEYLINAIKSLRGVLNVKPHVTQVETWMAEERALAFYREKIRDILCPNKVKNE